MAEVSTKPYLVRAIYEWCADNGYRPFIAVVVDERTQVPREFVRNGEIVLNISAAATNRLHIGNELLEFEARFSGVARHVSIPIDNVSAIFAEENGRGMAFEVPAHARHSVADEGASHGEHETPDDAHEAPGRTADAAPEAQAEGSGARQAKKKSQEPEADAPAAARTGGGKAASKRARKTPLRDVSAQPAGQGTPAEPTGESRRPKSRARKPAIAAVPSDPKPRGEPVEGDDRPASAQPDRSGDDDPGPGAPPPRGKPRLTRVK